MLKQLWNSRPIRAAFLFALFCHAIDVVSTMLAMRVGAWETNPLMRDPETFAFILRDGIAVKISAMVVAAIPTICLFWGEDGKPHWSPLPFYIISFPSLMAAMGNMFIYWKG